MLDNQPNSQGDLVQRLCNNIPNDKSRAKFKTEIGQVHLVSYGPNELHINVSKPITGGNEVTFYRIGINGEIVEAKTKKVP